MRFVTPAYLRGRLRVNGSKSHFIRVGLCSLFNKSENLIVGNVSKCDDNLWLIKVLKCLGLSVVRKDECLIIGGRPSRFPNEVEAGESGLLARMLFSLYSHFSNNYQILGSGTLSIRRMRTEENSLKSIGLNVQTKCGFLPISISGTLKSGEYFLDGSSGSQFLSGTLLALSMCEGRSVLNVENLKSKPYIDLTIKTLAEFGVSIEHKGYKRFVIEGKQNISLEKIVIESDWSSAAFFIVAAVISGDLELFGLDFSSTQADRSILNVFEMAGIDYRIEDGQLFVWKQKYDGFTFNAEHCPDLIPILIVLALSARTSSQISGVHRLRNKESDRAKVLDEEFAKLGVEIVLSGDTFLIKPQLIGSGRIDSHGDHRMAMAFSIAGLVSKGGIQVENSECVSKSYPEFYEDLESLTTNE